MASLVLSGDTSGSITVSAPAVAGSNTQTLVAATGTLAPLISGTAVTASSTSVEFTGIPSWVKRITVMFSGVSTNGTAPLQLQLGDSGGFETTGYTGSCANVGNPASLYTTGFGVTNGMASTSVVSGTYTLSLIGSNIWSGSGCLGFSNSAALGLGAGAKTLSDVLTSVRVIASTTGSPSDTFDAGTINILYE